MPHRVFGWLRWLTAALAVCVPMHGAIADDAASCLSRQVVELPLQALNSLVVVRVSAQGAPLNLIIDTGAQQTVVTEAAAKRIGLPVHRAYPRQMFGLGGGVTTGDALLSPLAAGGFGFPAAHVQVGPISLPAIGEQPSDGLLGADVLSNFDIDLDLPRLKLRLFSKQPCAQQPAAWNAAPATLEARRSINNRLFFSVSLDGHPLAALIDTGAQTSILDSAAAKAMGVSEAMLARDMSASVRGVASAAAPFHRHQFGRIVIGSLALQAPAFVVAPLHLEDADIVLGMDFLAGRRVRLDYDAHRIYLALSR